jgi:hypothetical protein
MQASEAIVVNENNPQIDLQDSVSPPAVRGSFNERWNKVTHQEKKGETELSGHSQTILNMLSESREAHAAEWLNELTHQVEESRGISTPDSGEPNTATEQIMLKWLNKIFDDLELYSASFNETNAGSEFFINCSRPEMVDLEPEHQSTDEKDHVQMVDGYLSTRTLAMLLRGTANKISIFLIPTTALLGFRTFRIGEQDFPPQLEIVRTHEQSRSGWKIKNKWIAYEQLSVFATQLFSSFVRKAALNANSSGQSEGPSVLPNANDPLLSDSSRTEQKHIEPSNHGTLLDPAVTEACKVMSIVIDQNVKRLLSESKRAIEVKNYIQFEETRQLIDQLSALKTFVNTTFTHISAANH